LVTASNRRWRMAMRQRRFEAVTKRRQAAE